MNIQKIPELIYTHIPNIIFALCIFILFWLISKIVQYGIKNVLKGKNPAANISNVIASIV